MNHYPGAASGNHDHVGVSDLDDFSVTSVMQVRWSDLPSFSQRSPCRLSAKVDLLCEIVGVEVDVAQQILATWAIAHQSQNPVNGKTD